MRHAARVAAVGATGYAGLELARLLLRHPQVYKPTFYLHDGQARARCLSEIWPQLRGWGEARCRPYSAEAAAREGAEIIFLATPHEASIEYAPELLKAGLRVVDLSGAFRFRDPGTFSAWYQMSAADSALLQKAVYGLPELYADSLPSACLIANPGCYATSVILALRPLVEASWLDRHRGVVCDCKSGVSGAGKQPKRETHFVEVNENLRTYDVFTHRHTPEIAEHAGLALNEMIFTTHLLPVERGILCAIYVWLERSRCGEDVEALYRRFYASRPMVRIAPAGRLPELRDVTHTNFCDIGFALDATGRRMVVISCLDNLGKGAAGQAVQNMNAMLGFEEQTGLI